MDESHAFLHFPLTTFHPSFLFPPRFHTILTSRQRNIEEPMNNPPATYLPLAGIRVLDLSRLLPGPCATQLFVALGAEVIKIETPRVGDHARLAPLVMGLGQMFEAVN